MIDKLTLTIEAIKAKSVEHFDETAIKQTVILRLLSDLDWNIFDREEVYPEYTIESRRVDFALRSNSKNKVFLEVKRPEENLERHQEQLLNYSFRLGVPIAILTNGITWQFYLPLKEGAWTNRKFYTIDFRNQSEKEIAEKLIAFLTKENVSSDKSIITAEQTLKSKNREREIEISLPVVWKNLLIKPSPEFVQIVADETEKHCGYRPTDEYVITFLSNSEEIKETDSEQNDNSLPAISSDDYNKRAEHTRLKVIFPDGQIINESKAIDTFIKTIQKFGIDKVKRLTIINGVPLISDKAFNVGDKKKYKQIFNTPYYINVNHGTPRKKEYLEKIARLLDKTITVQIE